MTRVIMEQTGMYTWRLITPEGKVLLDRIGINDAHSAMKWANAYVSSYYNWYADIKPLENKKRIRK